MFKYPEPFSRIGPEEEIFIFNVSVSVPKPNSTKKEFYKALQAELSFAAENIMGYFIQENYFKKEETY